MIPTPNLAQLGWRSDGYGSHAACPLFFFFFFPPVVLREQLAAARRAGMSFDRAWPGALEAAVNASQWEPAEWREALSGTVGLGAQDGSASPLQGRFYVVKGVLASLL